MGEKSRKRKKKVRKSVRKAIQAGFYLYMWWEDASKDDVVDKDEQKELISELVDIIGGGDINLE